MPFPVSVRGTLPAEQSADVVLAHVETMLRKAGARGIVREGSAVRFIGGIFRWQGFFNSWNILVPFGSGRIDVREGDGERVVAYDLSTQELAVMVTLLLMFGAAMIFSRPGPYPSQPSFLIFLIVGWFWLCGANYVIGRWRFRRWLRRGLTQLGNAA